MNVPAPGSSPSAPADLPPPPETPLPPTPLAWRVGIALAVVAVGLLAYALRDTFGYRVQALAGVICFIGVAAVFSKSLQSVNRKTLLWGVILQFALAVAVIHSEWVRAVFQTVGGGIKALVAASDVGAEFVFGSLAKVNGPPSAAFGAAGGGMMIVAEEVRNPPHPFYFAFRALPPIIFVSSFFSVLYYFGVLQLLVKLMARAMMYLMGTSGAETLSVAANVFMGQTEAPLIVKPFVPRMTRSELLALMGSGIAHISGGMMAVYISYGADPVSILCTCVMACPASLYLTKLVMPEAGKPATLGESPASVETPYVNAIDAAAAGVKDGLALALNVAAMLIGFLAFIALFDAILGGIKPALLSARSSAPSMIVINGVGLLVIIGLWRSVTQAIRNGGNSRLRAVAAAVAFILLVLVNRVLWVGDEEATSLLAAWPDGLRLETIFGWVFAPVAFLLGVDPNETSKVGSLLGIKLAANEHVAFLKLKEWKIAGGVLSDRSQILAVYALTGFANFASVGIQLGGIGSIAPNRRADLARLGMTALCVGFLATLLNAAVAGLLM